MHIYIYIYIYNNNHNNKPSGHTLRTFGIPSGILYFSHIENIVVYTSKPRPYFAYFPEPSAVTLELSKLSTATGHLIAEDLLREGLRHNGVRGRIKRTNNEHRQRSA